MKDKRFWLNLLYFLLHTVICCALLYLLVQSLTQASSTIVILLFVSANLLFALCLLKLSLRVAWAICAFLLFYLLLLGLSDFFASRTDSEQAIAILYNILQARMSLVLTSLFLLSSTLALRFGKYRSIEAVALLLLTFVLLTRDELSLNFENRYGLYRLLWLSIPSLNLVLLSLALHPYLRREPSWLSPSLAEQPRQSSLFKRSKQVASFVTLLLLLFAILWWTKISPINWNRTTHSRESGNGLLQKNLNNQFDFSEYLQLDSSLEQDRQLVMMSQIENLREDRPVYLTRFTLSGLDAKRSFFRDPKEPNMPGEIPLPLELERGTSLFKMPRYDLRQGREMYVFLLNIKPSSLFVLNYPIEVQTFENWPDSSFGRVYRVAARTLEDYFPFGKPLGYYQELLPEELMAYYTYLPEEYRYIGDFTWELLGQLLPKSKSVALASLHPLEIAQVIINYFHREYRYTLNPGIAKDGDQLHYFLFEGKKGYCTYFAFSAGLMLRSLGIPARVAVGFLLNPELRILNYYPLFVDQAHAWVEVFEPQQGWVTFDPTTFELAPGEEIAFGLPEGAEADLAALTEELLRNNSLNVEDGLKKLVPEKSPTRLLLSRLLETFRQQSWLLALLLLLLFVLLLLSYRARLLYLALHVKLQSVKRSPHLDKIVMAMYHYLQLLNTSLFAQFGQKKLPPRQLYAWQNALLILECSDKPTQHLVKQNTDKNLPAELKGQAGLLLYNSQACLDLFQKYYFSAHFDVEDAVRLRCYLQELAVPKRASSCYRGATWKFTWYPLYVLRSFYRFITKSAWR